jgi:hypothetical protein
MFCPLGLVSRGYRFFCVALCEYVLFTADIYYSLRDITPYTHSFIDGYPEDGGSKFIQNVIYQMKRLSIDFSVDIILVLIYSVHVN